MARASRLQAGQLRNYITLQRKTGAVNTSGEETDTWKDLAKVWASVEPFMDSRKGGSEDMQGGQLLAVAWTKIRMRYIDLGLTPKDRVSWDGRIFDIVNLNNRGEQNAEIELICKERQVASVS